MTRDYEQRIRERSDRFAAELAQLVREHARQVIVEALGIPSAAARPKRAGEANVGASPAKQRALRNGKAATSKSPRAAVKKERRKRRASGPVAPHPMGDALAELERRIIDCLAANPGALTAELRATTGLDKRRLRPVLTGMEQRGVIVPEAHGRSFRYWLASDESEPARANAVSEESIPAPPNAAASEAEPAASASSRGADAAENASAAPEPTRPVALWEQLKPGVLEQLRGQPGAGLEALADALDQEPLHVHKALRSLMAERRVRRLDRGWPLESRHRRIVRAEGAATGGVG